MGQKIFPKCLIIGAGIFFVFVFVFVFVIPSTLNSV